MKDESNKTEEEEEDDDASMNKPEPPVDSGPTEEEKQQAEADEAAQRRYDKQHQQVDSVSKVSVGSKQLGNAKDVEDVTKKTPRDHAEHEDPIVEMKDMPD